MYYTNVQSTERFGKGVMRMGYRVKEVREQSNMTQEELAKRSGVSRGTISAIENNSMRETTTKTLVKLALALGTTVEQIFFTDVV